jgi:hypothetical protein
MHLYRQPIIIFGAVLPILGAIALVATGSMLTSKMSASFNNKQNAYQAYEQSLKASRDIEAEVIRQRKHLERWNAELSAETASAVTGNLREIAETLPNKEFQQTGFERPAGSSGFGTASAQKSSQVRIGFRGTYRTLQRAFLDLETRMPQLQMQEMKMEPMSSSTSLMNVQVTYTAWEN